MADQLATRADLDALMQREVPEATATLLLEIATAVVQAETGQRLVEATSTETLIGSHSSRLNLPERPASDIDTVELDGEEITDYRNYVSHLWRADGWQACTYEPSTIEVTYTHGYAADSQDLQLARGVVLMLASGVAANPAGATQLRIDDYMAAYDAMATQLSTSETLLRALRKKYSHNAGLVGFS